MPVTASSHILSMETPWPQQHGIAASQVTWALRLLMDWSMDAILALFWIRTAMRIWLLAVRYMPHCCSKYPVLMACLLTMPAGSVLTLILFSSDICMHASEDAARSQRRVAILGDGHHRDWKTPMMLGFPFLSWMTISHHKFISHKKVLGP